MGYATQQDLVDRFGAAEIVQRTDRTNVPPSTIDAEVVTLALDDATALIDSYLRKLYALPLSTVPTVLTKSCADIARYFLWGEAADPKGPIASAYRDALSWLGQVADGTVQLEANGVPSPGAGDGARVQASRPEMTRHNLRGWI